MNWKCDVVMDLASLYHDGIASEGSRRLVREHLRQCPECRAYYRHYRSMRRKTYREAMRLENGQEYVRLAKRMRMRRTLAFSGVLSYVGATLCIFVLHSLHKKGKIKMLRFRG